jgi:catechol 2,3-dioxygenase-like lactoylglutathione lyase family enzyme
MPRLRQAVLAARDLEATVARLRGEFGLGEPYRDPAVAYFGLTNAVFAIGDTFLEVVSPVGDEPGAKTAARQLERSGAEICGYMAMVQIDDLAAARERVRAAGAREVFEVELDDIAEVHLHPGDMRAIVALSEPRPPESWRWGGEGWSERAIDGRVRGLTLAVSDPEAMEARWEDVCGGAIPGCRFEQDQSSPGIIEIELEVRGARHAMRPDRFGRPAK